MLGSGDDTAVWSPGPGNELATVDCLVQGVHFDLDTASWSDLGWKSLAVSLSDIAAMGGSPEYSLVSLGLPPDTGLREVTAFYEALTSLASDHRAAVAGGNLSSSPVVFASITVIGCAGGHLLTRGAARAGDAVAVSGSLGAAAAGRRLFGEKCRQREQDTPLRKAFLRPCPRLELGRTLVDAGISCAIDISDGLVADLAHICQASRVGGTVDVEKVPVHPAAAEIFPDRALQFALSGGEDYELLFTGPLEKLDRVAAEASCPVSLIGSITSRHPGEVRLFGAGGKPFSIEHSGWRHFEQNS